VDERLQQNNSNFKEEKNLNGFPFCLKLDSSYSSGENLFLCWRAESEASLWIFLLLLSRRWK